MGVAPPPIDTQCKHSESPRRPPPKKALHIYLCALCSATCRQPSRPLQQPWDPVLFLSWVNSSTTTTWCIVDHTRPSSSSYVPSLTFAFLLPPLQPRQAHPSSFICLHRHLPRLSFIFEATHPMVVSFVPPAFISTFSPVDSLLFLPLSFPFEPTPTHNHNHQTWRASCPSPSTT